MRTRNLLTALTGLLLLSASHLPAAPAATTADTTALDALRLVVNVPAGRLDVYNGARRLATYPVSVGLPAYTTPIGSYQVRTVTWNPTWTPPAVAWARGRKPVAPGPNNPMGRVKLFFFGPDYYIHGTENRAELGRPASHGCIRVSNQNVQALARLVHAYGSPRVNPAQLDWLAARPSATRVIPLARTVPLEVVYRRAEVRDGQLAVYADVYGRATDLVAETRAAFTRVGLDPARLDVERVRLGVGAASGRAFTVALSDATLPADWPFTPERAPDLRLALGSQ